jgi:undecaprenyl-diphosphatase
MALKLTFQRERPTQTNDPDEWFTGVKHQSFPSGDVSVAAALVTPLILEYGPSHWEVYGLVVIPVYDMFARTKYRAHWWTDVVAGAVVGAGSGWFAHELSAPVIIQVFPEGMRAGLSKGF